MNNQPYLKKEDRIYISSFPRDSFFDIPFAGVSYPNPSYLKRRDAPSDTIVFEYIIRGQGWLSSSDGNIPLNEGDLYIIDTHYPQCYYSDSANPYEKIWVNTSGTAIAVLTRLYLGERPYYIFHECQETYAYFYRIHSLLLNHSLPHSAVLEQTLLLFHQLLQYCRVSGSRNVVTHENIRNNRAYAIRDCLDRCVYTPLSMPELAERYNLSENQLRRSFQQVFGITPKQYLMKRRIEICEHLRSTTDMTIAELSELLCFSSPQHLSAAYNKIQNKCRNT